jgi:hypothetical protein
VQLYHFAVRGGCTKIALGWCDRGRAFGGGMKSPSWLRSVGPNHRVAGYCCVFVAVTYIAAVALLVLYLIGSLLW